MWGWILLVIILAVVLLIMALSLAIFHFIFGRPKRSKKIPKYYVGTPHYIASRAGMAIMEKLPCEDVYITSRDGLKLHAYLYPAEGERKKFVVGVHGYRSYARPEYGPYIAFYRSLGYSMLLPDDRAHAPSEGKHIGFGVLDRLDCVDWTKYLVKEYGGDVEIRLHGVSMGAATVLAASGEEDIPGQVRGIVADCGYSKAWDVLKFQFQQMRVPVNPFLSICESLCKSRAGYDFHEYAPVDQVRKSNIPTLIVHGGQDKMVPAFMAQEIYDACSAPKRLLMVDEAGHGESIAIAPERYHRAIHEFFGI